MSIDPADRGEFAQGGRKVDGRRLRSEESRASIIAALLALIREGETIPSAEAVAARAGVGVRTVFRHFADMESLFREVTEVMAAELGAVAARPFRSADWRERVFELIERRAGAFEAIAPLRRTADAMRLRHDGLQSDHSQLALALRIILLRVLPDAAAADTPLLEALDLLLSYETWDRLRSDQGLDAATAEATVARAVRALISPAP
jgi:AcrR family transcriptional regulator